MHRIDLLSDILLYKLYEKHILSDEETNLSVNEMRDLFKEDVSLNLLRSALRICNGQYYEKNKHIRRSGNINTRTQGGVSQSRHYREGGFARKEKREALHQRVEEKRMTLVAQYLQQIGKSHGVPGDEPGLNLIPPGLVEKIVK